MSPPAVPTCMARHSVCQLRGQGPQSLFPSPAFTWWSCAPYSPPLWCASVSHEKAPGQGRGWGWVVLSQAPALPESASDNAVKMTISGNDTRDLGTSHKPPESDLRYILRSVKPPYSASANGNSHTKAAADPLKTPCPPCPIHLFLEISASKIHTIKEREKEGRREEGEKEGGRERETEEK